MAQPIHNPFYLLLVAACGLMLLTILICVVLWVNPTAETPPWVAWIDRNWFWLVVGEISSIVVLAVLTISLDRFFDRDGQSDEPQ